MAIITEVTAITGITIQNIKKVEQIATKLGFSKAADFNDDEYVERVDIVLYPGEYAGNLYEIYVGINPSADDYLSAEYFIAHYCDASKE